MSKKSRNILLIVIFSLLILCLILSISYAYYVIRPENNTYEVMATANFDIPACIDIKIVDNNIFSLEGDYAIPVKDSRLLKSSTSDLDNYKYSFTLINNCESDATVTLSLAPLLDSNMPIGAMKYALVKQGTSLPTKGEYVQKDNNMVLLTDRVISDVEKENGMDIKIGYSLETVTLYAGENSNYNLYMWIDYYEGDKTQKGKLNNTTMDKTFSSVVVISDYAVSSEKLALPNACEYGTYFNGCIQSQYTIDGAGGLYLHDGEGTYTNADLEAGDNSLRYAGANPNNFVCFGSDALECPSDNLYRIIGVFGDKVKLIKWDYALQRNLLGYDGDAKANYGYTVNSTTNTQYRGVLTGNGVASVYYRNDTNDYANTNTTSVNDWSESRLNTINLNTNYLNNIGSKYADMISSTTWNVRKVGTQNFSYANTAKTAYDNRYSSSVDYVAKVGLMYVTDYYYAASPEKWSLAGTSGSSYLTQDGNYGPEYDYRAAIDSNWMYMGLYEWTIDSANGSTVGFVIENVGTVTWVYVYNNTSAVRPTFYLEKNVIYQSGNGTQTNPYRISLVDPICKEGQTLVSCIIDEIYGKVQNNTDPAGGAGVYYHDGQGTYANANLEIGDNSYRYVGSNPDNYICFYGDDCTNEDNLYRIIGVIDGKAKVVKYTNYGLMGRDFNADGTYSNYWEGSMLERYLNSNELEYTYYTSNGDANNPILNNTLTTEGYLHNLGTKANLIEETTWNVKGITELQSSDNKNAKGVYDLENKNSLIVKRKIGLMYIYEYMYAADSKYWSKYFTSYSQSTKNNWMWSSGYTWTISRSINSNRIAYLVGRDGEISPYFIYSGAKVQPSFSFKSSVKIAGGAGTKESPYVVYAGDLLTTYIKSLYTTDGENDLYYHDGKGTYTNANLEIGDNSYRYSGPNYKLTSKASSYARVDDISSESNGVIKYFCSSGTDDSYVGKVCGGSYTDYYYLAYDAEVIQYPTYEEALNKAIEDGYIENGVKNYVCFSEDANADRTCADDNLYRIIGVIDNKVKLIKYSIGISMFRAWDRNSQNNWEGSTMETYLNGEYLTKLGKKASLIDGTTWSVGGFTWSQAQSENAKGIYTAEMASTPTINRKIGLMYVHEYMYAAGPTYWSKVGSNTTTKDDYRLSRRDNWILGIWPSTTSWTISRSSDNNTNSFYIPNSGVVYATPAIINVIYAFPCFVISSKVRIMNSDAEDVGTKEVPMIIG